MTVLLDECLPRRLKNCLPGHDCRTVPEMGWAGKSNGELLALAEPSFDVLLTMDAGLDYQQNIRGHRLCIIILRARSNRYDDLVPLAPAILAAVETITPGTMVRLG